MVWPRQNMVQTLPRLLNLSFKRVGCFGNAFSCASERDLSFCTVTRRQESDWSLVALGGKSFRRAWWEQQNTWLGWHWPFPRMAQQSASLLLVGGRKIDMGVLSLCLPIWVSKMQLTEIFLNGNTSISLISKKLGWFLLFNSPVPVLGCFFY